MGKYTEASSAEDVYAQLIFDFEHCDDPLEKCECCIAFGSHDPHIALRASELYLSGMVNRIIFTGGFGRITSKTQAITEASLYKELALEAGVPAASIIVEEQSTNTGENILLTSRIIDELGLSGERHIFVERPYRQMRTRATLDAQWPQLDYIMTSPVMTYQQYCDFYEADGPISKRDFISLMVGDLQRILVYPAYGYQVQVPVPDDVLAAYEALVGMGFVSQMI